MFDQSLILKILLFNNFMLNLINHNIFLKLIKTLWFNVDTSNC